MFCPKCGAELPDSAEFCTKCGTKLAAGSAVQQPMAAQVDAPKKEKKKKSKLPIIIGAVIVLLIVIVIAVSIGGSGGGNIDYIATAKAHTPFASSQNLPYTYAEVFNKYTDNSVWHTDSENEKANSAIVKVDGIVKGTTYSLIVSIRVSPNPNDSNSCLIQPQSVNFNGTESTSQNNAVQFLYIMFAAYGEGFEDLSEVLSNPDEVYALLTDSGFSDQPVNTELTESYTNANMGISFLYPSDWVLLEESESSVSITKTVTDYASGSGFAANFGVYDLTEAYEGGMLGIDVFTEDVAALEENYNQQGNTTVLSIEDVIICEAPARVLKYQTGGLNGTDPVIVRDCYINRGKIYRITCSCSKSIADTYEQVFDAIINSCNIESTTTGNEPAPSPYENLTLVYDGDDQSWITLFRDGTFTMQANVYAGYATMSGTYEETAMGFKFQIEARDSYGFLGDDVEEFEIVDKGNGVFEYKGDWIGTTFDGSVYLLA